MSAADRLRRALDRVRTLLRTPRQVGYLVSVGVLLVGALVILPVADGSSPLVLANGKGKVTTTTAATTTTTTTTTTTAPTSTTSSTTSSTSSTTSTTAPISTTTTKKPTGKVTTTTSSTVPWVITIVADDMAAPRNGSFDRFTVNGCSDGTYASNVYVTINKTRSQFETLWVGTTTQSIYAFGPIEAPDNFTPGQYLVTAQCTNTVTGAIATATTNVQILKAPGPYMEKPGPYGPTATLSVVPGSIARGESLVYVAGQECPLGNWVTLNIVKARKKYFTLGLTTVTRADGVFTFEGKDLSPIPWDIQPGNYVLYANCQSGAIIDYTLAVK